MISQPQPYPVRKTSHSRGNLIPRLGKYPPTSAKIIKRNSSLHLDLTVGHSRYHFTAAKGDPIEEILLREKVNIAPIEESNLRLHDTLNRNGNRNRMCIYSARNGIIRFFFSLRAPFAAAHRIDKLKLAVGEKDDTLISAKGGWGVALVRKQIDHYGFDVIHETDYQVGGITLSCGDGVRCHILNIYITPAQTFDGNVFAKIYQKNPDQEQV